MDGGGGGGGAQYNPRTVEEVFRDFKGRRAGMIKALTTGSIVLAKVFCVGCNMHLGQKIVKVESPTNLLREGRVEIEKKKLLSWDGHQMLEAVTLLPQEIV